MGKTVRDCREVIHPSLVSQLSQIQLRSAGVSSIAGQSDEYAFAVTAVTDGTFNPTLNMHWDHFLRSRRYDEQLGFGSLVLGSLSRGRILQISPIKPTKLKTEFRPELLHQSIAEPHGR